MFWSLTQIWRAKAIAMSETPLVTDSDSSEISEIGVGSFRVITCPQT